MPSPRPAVMVPQATAAVPQLTRVVVSDAGRIKANFSDGSILVLSPSGRAFSMIQADGTQQRQLSDFVLSRHAPSLAVVLEFRNMHFEKPFYCARLMNNANPRDALQLGFRMSELYWPRDAHEALAKGLGQWLDGDKVSVSTEDDAARIVLHALRQRFAVCYPVPVREVPSEGTYEYVWQTQVFSLAEFPQRWEPAVELLLQVATRLDEHGHAQLGGHTVAAHVDGSDEATTRTAVSTSLPCRPAADGRSMVAADTAAGGDSTTAAVQTQLPSALPEPDAAAGGDSTTAAVRTELPSALPEPTVTGFQDSCPAEGWWAEPTLSLLPNDCLVVMEWTPQATYHFHASTCEAEAWIHADDSCLFTRQGGRFVAHVRPGMAAGTPPTESLYACSCVPESSWAHDRGERYALAPIAAHLGKLRARMAGEGASAATRAPLPGRDGALASATSSLALAGEAHPQGDSAGGGGGGLGLLANAAEETFAVQSEALVDESHVPNQGTYCAYADGRVRVRFIDRTILHMNAARTFCKIIKPDGSTTLVATDAPIGVEGHVRDAQGYARWAFATPAQHAEEAHVQARVQAELTGLNCMTKMLDWTVNKRAGASGAGGGNTTAPLLELTNHMPAPGAPESVPSFSLEDVNAMLARNQQLMQRL